MGARRGSSSRRCAATPRAERHRTRWRTSTPRLPFTVADYADFYASLEHATNLGRILRPGSEPLLPNWRQLPVGYHGRAGTVVVSGTDVVRPCGQYLPARRRAAFGPSRRLDIELELGFVDRGRRARTASPSRSSEALRHVFGVVLLNDWSARDLQAWEYQPLGPVPGQVVRHLDLRLGDAAGALVAFARRPPGQEPAPLPYLREAPWALDLALEVELNGAVIARDNARHLYWSPAQMIAHLTANGASLRTGDLLGSGTISGPGRERARLADRAELERRAAAGAARRRAPHASSRTATWSCCAVRSLAAVAGRTRAALADGRERPAGEHVLRQLGRALVGPAAGLGKVLAERVEILERGAGVLERDCEQERVRGFADSRLLGQVQLARADVREPCAGRDRRPGCVRCSYHSRHRQQSPECPLIPHRVGSG